MKAIITGIVFLSLLTGAGIAQPMGEVVGTTYYPMQTLVSAGHRIAVCDDNSIYICWMNLLGWPYPPAPRHIYINWRDPEGVWNPNGFEGQVNQVSGAGYPKIDEIYGNRGAIVYHSAGGSYPTYVTISVDYDPPGDGFFDHYNPPDEIFPQNPDSPGRCYWPDISVDRNDNMHIVMTELTERRPQRLCYTNSTDGGDTWCGVQLIDTVMLITAIVVSSPVSDRAAVCHLIPNDTMSQSNNEVCYYIAEDGLTWDWIYGRIQITDYENSGSDHRVVGGVEAIFDYDSNLHVAWTTYADSITWLWHYDENSETISLIANNPETIGLSMNQVSLSRLEDPQLLLALWCQYAEGDTNFTGGYNGDLFLSRSFDGGSTWSWPENITDTQSPGCTYCNCQSEIFPSAEEDAEFTFDGGFPYLTYIYDPFIDWDLSCTCSVMFLGPEHITDVADNRTVKPNHILLAQNYPNPFNNSTTIKYDLKQDEHVTIDIYDLLGRKVETLVSIKQQAGIHSIIWDAEELSSGMYFSKIEAGKSVLIKKMLLLR